YHRFDGVRESCRRFSVRCAARLRPGGGGHDERDDRRGEQHHHEMARRREIELDRPDMNRRPVRQLNFPGEVVLHRKARQIELVAVRDVRRDEIGLRGRWRLHGRGRVSLRVQERGREREKNDSEETNRSHGFRKNDSIKVETKKNPAKLSSAGCSASPNAFTPKYPNNTSESMRKIMPSAYPAITFTGCISRINPNDIACTTTATATLAHTDRATSPPEPPGTASVITHATTDSTAVIAARKLANVFISVCRFCFADLPRRTFCFPTSTRCTSSRTRHSRQSMRRSASAMGRCGASCRATCRRTGTTESR